MHNVAPLIGKTIRATAIVLFAFIAFGTRCTAQALSFKPVDAEPLGHVSSQAIVLHSNWSMREESVTGNDGARFSTPAFNHRPVGTAPVFPPPFSAPSFNGAYIPIPTSETTTIAFRMQVPKAVPGAALVVSENLHDSRKLRGQNDLAASRRHQLPGRRVG